MFDASKSGKKGIPQCSICTGEPGRLEEINALLADGTETIKSISIITGASVGTIHRHKQHAFASPGGPASRHGALHELLEKLLKSAIRKGETKRAVELTGQIADLHKLEERTAAREADAPAAQPQMSVSAAEAVREALGGVAAPISDVVEMDYAGGKYKVTKLSDETTAGFVAAWLEQNEDDESKPEAVLCGAMFLSFLEKREIDERAKTAVGKFLLELQDIKEGDDENK